MKKKLALVLMAMLMVGSLAACGGAQEDNPKAAEKASTVATDGSTSMERVIGILGESFHELHPDINVTYNPTGSGSGISAVAEGRCDIGLSSRDLHPDETAKGLVAKVVAKDGIAVVVNPENSVKNLTMEQLAKIYTGEIKNWKEVGGKDEEIVVIGREAGSGTRDGFESVTKTKEKCKYRQELSSTGDVIAIVAKNPSAIGYTSLAAVKDNVKALMINNVAPKDETVRDGSYKLQRNFNLITKKDTKLSKIAQEFYDYATSKDVANFIAQAGAVALK